MKRKKRRELPKRGARTAKNKQLGGSANGFDIQSIAPLLERLQQLFSQNQPQGNQVFDNLNQFQINADRGFQQGGSIGAGSSGVTPEEETEFLYQQSILKASEEGDDKKIKSLIKERNKIREKIKAGTIDDEYLLQQRDLLAKEHAAELEAFNLQRATPPAVGQYGFRDNLEVPEEKQTIRNTLRGMLNLPPKNPNQLRLGGLINNTGYTKGSPTEANPLNIIPGGIITTKNTDQDLLGYPIKNGELGIPRRLKAKSGIVDFGDVDAVLEIPAPPEGKDFKLGGMTKRHIMDVFSAPFISVGSYQQGGFVEEEPRFVGIQTEKGEMLIHLDSTITDVKAKRLHSEMDDDDITDIVPEGTYVVSDHFSMMIDKEDTEDIEIGTIVTPYDEHSFTSEPEVINLSSLFPRKKSKATPADLVRKVRQDFKIEDRDDYFTQMANEENRKGRVPYLRHIVNLAERQRTGEDIQVFQKGGSVLRRKGTQSHQLGALALASAVPSILGSVQGLQANNRRYRRNVGDINRNARQQRGYATRGAALGIAGLLNQNPVVQAPNLSTSYLNNIQTDTPTGLTDFALGRVNQTLNPLARQTFGNTGSFQRAVNSLQPSFAEGQGTISSIANQEFQNRLTRRAGIGQQRGALQNEQIRSNAVATNSTNANQNKIGTGVAGFGSGLQTTLANIAGNTNSNLTAARNDQFETQQQLINQIGQSAVSAASAGLSGIPAPASPNQNVPGQTFDPSTATRGSAGLGVTPVKTIDPLANPLSISSISPQAGVGGLNFNAVNQTPQLGPTNFPNQFVSQQPQSPLELQLQQLLSIFR